MLWQIGLFGQNGVDPTQITVQEITAMIVNIVSILLMGIGIVVFIYIVMAGIQYVTAAGNAGKQGEAKKTITAAVVGLVIVIAAFAITRQVLRWVDFDASIINNDYLSPEIRRGIGTQ